MVTEQGGQREVPPGRTEGLGQIGPGRAVREDSGRLREMPQEQGSRRLKEIYFWSRDKEWTPEDKGSQELKDHSAEQALGTGKKCRSLGLTQDSLKQKLSILIHPQGILVHTQVCNSLPWRTGKIGKWKSSTKQRLPREPRTVAHHGNAEQPFKARWSLVTTSGGGE